MKKVGIIGGMGPFAGSNYLECFLEECTLAIRETRQDIKDQWYPAHYVLQYPVSDRTDALLKGPKEYKVVFDELLAQVKMLDVLGVSAAAIACNTAHAWHSDLRDAFPHIELIHIATAAANYLADKSVRQVCLMATAGTVRSGMYSSALASQGIRCMVPNSEELTLLMAGIYDGVKAGDLGAGEKMFSNVVASMSARTGVHDFLMACTEIPLALNATAVGGGIRLFDPTKISARRLAQIAFT